MKPRHLRKPLLLYAGCAVILAAGAYLIFELGRYQAGYSLLDQRRQAAEYRRLLVERDGTIEELRRRLAVLETSREIDQETYAQVESTLSELQARIQAQEEELAFYRGIVSPQDGVPGLRIQNLEIQPADGERRHVLRLVLVQAIVHSDPVAGVVRLTVAGSLDEEPTELDLGQLTAETAEQVPEIAYDFRYFQSFERELILPEGFEPATVQVELRPDDSDSDAVTQSFDWSAVNG